MPKSIVLGAMFLCLFISRDVSACECDPPGSPREELSQARVVFIGRVKAQEDVAAYNMVKTRFEVEKFYKNIPAPGDYRENSIEVMSYVDGKACGIEFVMDEEYLVFASSFRTGELATDSCTRTKKLSESAEDLAELDKP